MYGRDTINFLIMKNYIKKKSPVILKVTGLSKL